MFIKEYRTRCDGHWFDVALSLEIIGPTVGRYEFQGTNSIGIIKSWLHLSIHGEMWSDVRSTLCGIAHLNDWIIMGRYEFQWNNAFRIVRCHPYWGIHCQRCCALLWCGFYVALPLKVIGPTVSRYEFQVMKPIGIMRWRLCRWLHYPVLFVLMKCRLYLTFPLDFIGSTVCRYAFQGMNCIGIIKWRLHVY